jgi:carboxyl-terminal processing protease
MALMIRRGSGIAFALGALCMWTAQVLWPPAEAEAGSHALSRSGFDAALGTVLERYVDPIDASPVLTETLKRVVSGLDSYSHFLTADERSDIRHRSRGGSTGMETQLHRAEPGARKPASLEISAVLPGSPAERVGLRPGDQILKIRGHDVGFLLSQAEAAALLLGADGDTVELTVQRRGDPAPAAVSLVLSGVPKNLVDARPGRARRPQVRPPEDPGLSGRDRRSRSSATSRS